MSTNQPNPQGNNPSDSEEEERINYAHEESIGFPEGFYQLTETREIRRAKVEGIQVLWFDLEFDVFVGVERKSFASSRRLLEEIRYLPNYQRS